MGIQEVLTSEEIAKLFTEGTVILFKCEAGEDFPLTFVSENCSEILGFDSSYFLNNKHGWSERIHPEDRTNVLQIFRGITELESAICEYRFKRKDGTYIWLRDELKLISDENGIPAAILGSSLDITGRKCAEDKLRESKEKYQSVVEQIKDVAYSIDEKLNWTYLNHAWTEVTDYSLQETLGKSFLEFIHPEDREICERICNNLLNESNRDFYSHIVRLLKHNGDYIWVEINARRTKDMSFREGLNITGTLVNVTSELIKQKKIKEVNETLERRIMRRSQELKDEKRLSEAIIDSLPGIFYMLDQEGNYLKWNKNFIEQVGYTAGEIDGLHPSDLFEEEEFRKIEYAIQQVFEKGEASTEAEVLTKDGYKIPYYLTGKRFKQSGKEYLIGSGYNISEKKRAMDKLKKSEELFRNLFLRAPAAIVMVDVNNKVLMVNQSFQELFGYSESEIIEKDLDRVIVPPEDYDSVPKMPAVDFKGSHYYHQAQRIARNGEVKHVFVGSIPIYVDDKPYVGFGMYIDITEQVKYEEKISDSLKEKQILLQEIHHRVKNNLAVVSGLIQLQIYEVDNEYIQRTLQESQSRIQTMALIHEKLYQSNNLSRISCRSYIEELIQTIQNTFSTSVQQIRINTDIDDVELNINKAMPFALLLNEVISNAFEHAFPDQQGIISVELFEEEAWIYVKISDNGIGIPDDYSIEEEETLGMTLIHNFLNQLEAEWELCNRDGTTLSLSFSKEYAKGSSSIIL